MALDLAKHLSDLVSANAEFKQRVGLAPQTKEAGEMGQMLETFKKAFPDDDFVIVQGASGPVIEARLKSAAAIQNAVPEGFSSKFGQQGISDLQTALESATDDEEKLKIAIRLNAAVQTQKAFNFGQYKQRAESEFGIPDMLQAIEQVRQAELRSPHNPGTGMPSAQRMALIEALGQARVRAAGRVAELMAVDTSLVGAENIAKSTLVTLDALMKLDERRDRNFIRDAQRASRENAIGSIDPRFVSGVSILKRGKAPKDAQESRSIAEQLVDGKIKLTESERLLANANVPTLADFYTQTKNTKEKTTAIQMIEAREAAFLNDPIRAKENVAIFKQVMDMNLADPNLRLSPDIKQRISRANVSAAAQAAASGRTKDEMLNESMRGIRRELLAEVVKQSIYADVGGWNGLVKSDETAQGIFRKLPRGERVTLQRFIDEYLSVQNGQDIAAKSKSLQAIIVSGISAIPKSEILPIPAEESLQLEAQRMIAAATIRVLNPTSGFPSFLRDSVLGRAFDIGTSKGAGQ